MKSLLYAFVLGILFSGTVFAQVWKPAGSEAGNRFSASMEPFFDRGRLPVLNVKRKNGPVQGKTLQYSLKATDLYTEKTVLNKKENCPGENELPAKLTLDLPYGVFKIEFSVAADGKTLYRFQKDIVHFMPEGLSSDPTVRAYEYEYSPLGGVFGTLTPEQANAYGASWIRFEHPNWRNNERNPGKYEFSGMVEKMKTYVRSNVRPVVLQTLYHYPKFVPASDAGAFSLGYGMHLRRAAAALNGLTRYFELGNEDNGHTKFIYTEICRHAAAGIRSAQPFAVLSNSGTAYVDYNWLEFQGKRGLWDVLDAFCVHPYTNNSTPSQSVGPEKSGIFEKLTQLYELVDASGGMKQLWSTEYGWPNSKLRKGEHDRADLYVREMLIGEMAGLEINGLYTWRRDYGIFGRPAGAAIQAYARMREGRRFAGFYRENDVYVAVYEKDGNGTAVVWTPEAGERRNPVNGGKFFDIFGNPLKAETVRITQSPVYIRNVVPAVLEKAAANTTERARLRYEKNFDKYQTAGFEKKYADAPSLHSALEKWSRKTGSVSKKEQTLVSSLLHYYLSAGRYDKRTPETGNAGFAERRKRIEARIREENAGLKDIPGVRYLLNLAARLEAESAMLHGKKNRINFLTGTIYSLAERFVRDGERIQYAVFAHLSMKQGEKLGERLSFVPGREKTVKVRISSYAPTEKKVSVRLETPSGWTVDPAVREAVATPEKPVFVDFKVRCPANPAPQNTLKAVVEIPDCPSRVTAFNDVEIVPAVTVEAEPVSGTLPEKPLILTIRNQENCRISGDVIILTADGNQELTRLKLNGLLPFQTQKIPVKFSDLPDGNGRMNWNFTALFLLSDKRRFQVPFNVDFLYASERKAPIKIDAKLDEWKNTLPLRINKAEYARGSYGDSWTEEDCSAVSGMMWDSGHLYFSAVVRDQTFNQQQVGDSTWKQDSIQLIFADPEERVPFEITLALTPAGPQAWGKRLLNDVQLAVEYRNGCIYYEAAIPWTVFPGKLKHCVSKKGFLYGIAINDDDAIVPRRFLERFDGSIVHGKRVDAFAPVSLGNSIRDTKPAKTVFFENFSQDANGKTPLRWFNHTSRMPENSNVVESSPGAEDGKALVLRNQNGVRPNRFAINVAALQLQPGKKYELSARMNRIPADCSTVVGVCADIWGNKDQKFLKLSPVSGYRVFKRDFTAPLNGKCNVIIKNVCKLDGLQIDWIKIKEKE